MKQGFTFEADDKPLSDILFESKRKYRIPRYQRPYAWGVEEVSDFWEDLISSEEPYFIGSLIFNTEKEKEETYVDIIDGQQRILTITILMAAIRDVAQEIGAKEAELFQRQDIAIEDWEGNSSFRIKPAESLESYFYSFIQCDDGDVANSKTETDEEDRVKANYIFLKNRITAEVAKFQTKEHKIEVLKGLRGRLRELMVIDVEISREEDAYDIFETTNARGMELSVSDLLKNLIFKNIKPGPDKDLAKEVWQDITRNIEETGTELKKFIRYFWISKHGFVQEKKLYKEVKKKIANSQWDELLQDLWDEAQRYHMLLEGEQSELPESIKHRQNIFESVFSIRLMNVSQCYVLLLSTLRNYEKLGFDPYKVFQFIEKFTFQYSVICKLPGNRLEKIYSKYALKIEDVAKQAPGEKRNKEMQSAFTGLQNELKSIAPSENVFGEYFSALTYKNNEENRRLIKYILGRVDSYYQQSEEYLINFNKVNIEHILPQNPDKEWKLAKKDIKDYVNKLGNLTLLSQVLNSKAQNGPISVKLPEFKRSELQITKKLVEKIHSLGGKWGRTEILSRHKELGIIAYQNIWTL